MTIETVKFESGMLLQLADFLEQLPVEKFDYMQWGAGEVGEDGLFGEDCGMVCCAGGWACKLFPDKLQLWGNSIIPTGAGYCDSLSALAICFGIRFIEAKCLFIPHSEAVFDGILLKAPMASAKPKEVAAHIRNFVKLKLLVDFADAIATELEMGYTIQDGEE